MLKTILIIKDRWQLYIIDPSGALTDFLDSFSCIYGPKILAPRWREESVAMNWVYIIELGILPEARE